MPPSRKQEIKRVMIDRDELRGLLAEYEYNEDSIFEEDERVYMIKQALSKIDQADRIIFCLYLDLQSERKVAKQLGVSRTPINRAIKRIKKEIIDLIND